MYMIASVARHIYDVISVVSLGASAAYFRIDTAVQAIVGMHQRYSVSWILPELQATVVRLADAEQAAAALRPHGIRLRELGDDAFVAWARAPLATDALARARATLCAPTSEPSMALLELLCRDCVDECLAEFGLYRVGDADYLRRDQLCASGGEEAGGVRAGRAERRLQPVLAVRGSVTVSVRARAPTATASFELCVLRLRPQRPWRPLVLSTLLPHLRKALDANGLVDLRPFFHDYEARSERAVALLVPSLARVTVLALATDRAALQERVVSKLALVRAAGGAGGSRDDDDDDGEYALKPDVWDLRVVASGRDSVTRKPAPPPARIPLGEAPLWALVQLLESGAGAGGGNGGGGNAHLFEDDVDELGATYVAHESYSSTSLLGVDARALAAALLELDSGQGGGGCCDDFNGSAPSPRTSAAQRVIIVNAIHLFDAVGIVPSTMEPAAAEQQERAELRGKGGTPSGAAERGAGQPSALDACGALCAALGGGDPPPPDAEAARATGRRPVGSAAAPRVADLLQQRGGPAAAPGARPVVTSSAALGTAGGAREMEVDSGAAPGELGVGIGCGQGQANAAEATSGAPQPRAAPAFRTAAQIHSAGGGGGGGGAGRRQELSLRDVLQPICPAALSPAGFCAIDSAFARCDRDKDGLLCRSDLDFFQAATGGEPLDDDDLDYFCASFESVGRALTRAGFRAYFLHALSKDAAAALADLKALAS